MAVIPVVATRKSAISIASSVPANVEIIGAPALGRSGGGLFDQQGQLIGVCNAADTTDNEGIYAAAEVVYAQIERLGMTHLFDSQTAAPNTQLAAVDRAEHRVRDGFRPSGQLRATK